MNPAELNEALRRYQTGLAAFDDWEVTHAQRVAVLAVAAAEALGRPDEELAQLRAAAELHDIGKLARPEPPQGHPEAAADVIREPWLRDWVAPVIARHHERFDGSGYPDGLIGDEIPILAQVIGAAEYMDIRRHGAPWSEAREAAEWINGFSPEVRDALEKVAPLIQPVGL